MTKITGPLPGGFLNIPPSSEPSAAGSYALPELSAGERVDAAILSSPGKGQYLIQLKNAVLPARSDLVFPEGEKITVVVDRLYPEVLLRIAGRSIQVTPESPAFLPGTKAGASSLFRLFADISGLPAHREDAGPYGTSGARPADALLSLVRVLVLSKEVLRDPLFIRNYVFHLGLLHEKASRDGGAGAGEKAGSRTPSGGSLKGLLLRAAADPQFLEALWGREPDGKRSGQDVVRQFVDNGLGAIETEQLLNLVLQETENRYFLSLPFLFPGGFRMQDLVIQFDRRRREGGEAQRSFQVTLHLDLDVLGKAIADVTMTGDRVGCAIRFEEKKGRDLLAPHMEELAGRLKASGYGLQFLTCTEDPGVREDREAFLRQRLVYMGGGLDCVA